MTTPNYRFTRIEGPVTNYAVDPTDTINMGDIMAWDASNKVAIVMAADTDFAHFIGIANGNVPAAPGVDNSMQANSANTVEVAGEGIFNMKSTDGETYAHGIALAMGADAQTVRLDNSDNRIIGYVYLPEGGTITGGAGVLLPMRAKRNYPNQLP